MSLYRLKTASSGHLFPISHLVTSHLVTLTSQQDFLSERNSPLTYGVMRAPFLGETNVSWNFVSITYMWRCVLGCYRKYICHRRSWPKHLRNICSGTSCHNPNLLKPRFSPPSLAIAFLQPLWSFLSKHTCSMLDPNTKCNSDISQFFLLSPVNRVSHFPTELGNHFDLCFCSKSMPKTLA